MTQQSKPLYLSRTLWFNIVIGMFAVLSEYTHLLRDYLSDGGYMAVLMFVAVGNAYLRMLTTTAVRMK